MPAQYDREHLILIVDDDDTLLKFFKIHLNKFFSRILVVKNAKEATDALKEKPVDLVISDIKMPKTDGIQLLKKVRRIDFTIPMLLISGALIDTEKQNQVKEESDGFLKKPFSIDELHNFINKGIERRKLILELKDLIDDKKKLKDLLNGKLLAEKLPTKSTHQRTSEIIELLTIKPNT